MTEETIIEKKIEKPKSKMEWVNKKMIVLTIIMTFIFITGMVAGAYIMFNVNVSGPYEKGQASILNKYYCTDRQGYNIKQCTLPECQNLT